MHASDGQCMLSHTNGSQCWREPLGTICAFEWRIAAMGKLSKLKDKPSPQDYTLRRPKQHQPDGEAESLLFRDATADAGKYCVILSLSWGTCLHPLQCMLDSHLFLYVPTASRPGALMNLSSASFQLVVTVLGCSMQTTFMYLAENTLTTHCASRPLGAIGSCCHAEADTHACSVGLQGPHLHATQAFREDSHWLMCACRSWGGCAAAPV